MMVKIGKLSIGKECAGRWFPGIGYGYWDGFRYAIKRGMNIKFRTFDKGFAIGPLMFWKDR